MSEQIQTRRVDGGQPVAMRDDRGRGFAVTMRACMARHCTCTTVELGLSPLDDAAARADGADGDEGGAREARVVLDATTREVQQIVDPDGLLAGDVDEAWVRGRLAGDIGELAAYRFARTRAEIDHRSWQAYDWAAHRPGRMVAHHELFPHDWDVVARIDGRWLWFDDLHCVRPRCACQEIALVVSDLEGAALGDVKVRLGPNRKASVIAGTGAARAAVREALAHHGLGPTLHRRHGAMRSVARRLETWAADRVDPAAAALAVLDRPGALEVDHLARVHALGEAAVAALAAVVVDPGAPGDRRRRAARLLAAIDEPAIAAPLAVALAWPELDDDLDAIEDVDAVLASLRRPALEPLLAALPTTEPGSPTEARVQTALAELRIADPRVLAVVAARAEEHPADWLRDLAWQGPAAVPVVYRLLTAALDAGPARLDEVTIALEVLEQLDAELPVDLRERVDGAMAASAARTAAARAQLAEGRRLEAEARAQVAKISETLEHQYRALLAEVDARLASGRNQPCPCGSGSKYKKCHLAVDEDQRRRVLTSVEELSRPSAFAPASDRPA